MSSRDWGKVRRDDLARKARAYDKDSREYYESLDPNRLPPSDMRCWCGGELNHDWPGKADDAPHPRG